MTRSGVHLLYIQLHWLIGLLWFILLKLIKNGENSRNSQASRCNRFTGTPSEAQEVKSKKPSRDTEEKVAVNIHHARKPANQIITNKRAFSQVAEKVSTPVLRSSWWNTLVVCANANRGCCLAACLIVPKQAARTGDVHKQMNAPPPPPPRQPAGFHKIDKVRLVQRGCMHVSVQLGSC